MKKYLLLLLLLLAGCSSTKVDFKKVNLADTTLSLFKFTASNFRAPFRALDWEEAYKFAETDTRRTAAKALEYLMQNRYEDAADMFCNAMMEKDSLEWIWRDFPSLYYSNINYNWEKLEKYENIRNGITDSSFVFYKDKPKFNIEFIEDSVVIPIKLKNGFPFVKIKINGKYYYFIVDTGCSRTIIGKNIAAKNNIVYYNKEQYAQTITGYSTIYNSFIPEFDLGQIKIYNYPIYVINTNDAVKMKLLFITFLKSDGVIGWDLLQRFDFTIDYKNKQLILRKPTLKNIENKNLYWYQIPIVKFYSGNNYPLLFFFDSGSNMSSFDERTLSYIHGIDINNLKTSNKRVFGVDGTIKNRFYKYENFQCYTISNNEINYLTANKILLEELSLKPINLDGILGSNWFEDKAIRVDMLNGIFEILE